MSAILLGFLSFWFVTMAIVQIDHVSKSFRLGEQTVLALDDVSLEIEPGVFLAIAGPSGSGKSTLLNIIGCIDTPSSGRVVVDGHDGLEPYARRTGRSACPYHRLHLPDL